MSEWISVEERLPETAGEYLVVYHPCHWDAVSEKVCVGIDTFRGKTAWAKKKYQRVTHWMPLPESPKEGCDTNGEARKYTAEEIKELAKKAFEA